VEPPNHTEGQEGRSTVSANSYASAKTLMGPIKLLTQLNNWMGGTGFRGWWPSDAITCSDVFGFVAFHRAPQRNNGAVQRRMA
jgi:hypothetical protein